MNVSMGKIPKEFAAVLAHSKKIGLLDGISYLLEWDQETYMPSGAAEIRSEQVQLVADLIHKERTGKDFTKALSKLIDLDSGKVLIPGLSLPQKAALREWRRDYLHAKALPKAFVSEFAKLTSGAMALWGKARKKNDFKAFAPTLEKIVSMCRKKTDYLGYEQHPYDALLDCFEPHMTTKELDQIFPPLQKSITALLKKINSCKQVDNSCIHGKFSPEKQLQFCHTLLKAMGYDLNKGRMDISNHPFSLALHPTDSRITTRIHPSSLIECISAVMHEGGHSLYEMGLMPEYFGSPLSEATSLGIHESQSRFWETRIGLSKPFWKHFYPSLLQTFPKKLEDVSLEQFYKAINKVTPSPIRVEADEVTYSLHVILRYEIEKELITGALKVKDIPERWNSMMQKYLGITPKTNREGCLQDIHWSVGGFGYFPTYALGNLYASHFFSAFEKEHPDWEKKVGKGELLFIKGWLNEKIHKFGRTYSASELAEKVSGKKLSQKSYVDYLTKKYSAIYS